MLQKHDSNVTCITLPRMRRGAAVSLRRKAPSRPAHECPLTHVPVPCFPRLYCLLYEILYSEYKPFCAFCQDTFVKKMTIIFFAAQRNFCSAAYAYWIFSDLRLGARHPADVQRVARAAGRALHAASVHVPRDDGHAVPAAWVASSGRRISSGSTSRRPMI